MNESDYKPDFELLDRYQSFSSELIKLGLAGVGVLGFFISYGIEKLKLPANSSKSVLIVLCFAAAAFMLTSAFAMAHRYYSADGMFYHLRALRRKAAGRQEESVGDGAIRNRIYERSGIFLGISALFCFLGAKPTGSAPNICD